MVEFTSIIANVREVLQLRDRDLGSKQGLFYIDETNNSVNFNIKNGNFNTENQYFLCGGLFINTKNPHSRKRKIEKQIEQLFESFDDRFQHKYSTQSEVKFKSFIPDKRKRGNFIRLLSDENVQKIIHWIYKNNYFFKYTIVDNLFYGIADLVDPLLHSEYRYGFDESLEFKTIVTKAVKQNKQIFISLLKKYNAPNIKASELESFYEELGEFIEEYSESENIDYMYNTRNPNYEDANILLSSNKDDVLIDKYVETYLTSVVSFPKSLSIIDRQEVVEEKFKQLNLPKRIATFGDSKDNVGLQLADYIVNILKLYIDFLNNINNVSEKDIALLNTESTIKSAFFEFTKILKNSREYSELLVMSVITTDLSKQMLMFENNKYLLNDELL